jgi:hypothetical protein
MNQSAQKMLIFLPIMCVRHGRYGENLLILVAAGLHCVHP